jgi:lysine-specific histone demethylase 1B
MSEMELWQKRWDLRAGVPGNLRLFIGDRLLPFWLQCTECHKWRPISCREKLTPSKIASFQCGKLSPHHHPNVVIIFNFPSQYQGVVFVSIFYAFRFL